jgi:hypothetical protein
MHKLDTVRFGMVQDRRFMVLALLIDEAVKYVGSGGIDGNDDVIGCRRTGEREP